MNKIAIIGSRETPIEILEVMRDLVIQLRNTGTKIRSGGAPGADHVVLNMLQKKREKYIYLGTASVDYTIQILEFIYGH